MVYLMNLLYFLQNLKKDSYPKIEFVPAEVCLFDKNLELSKPPCLLCRMIKLFGIDMG